MDPNLLYSEYYAILWSEGEGAALTTNFCLVLRLKKE
jgi:hypothetical protein